MDDVKTLNELLLVIFFIFVLTNCSTIRTEEENSLAYLKRGEPVLVLPLFKGTFDIKLIKSAF